MIKVGTVIQVKETIPAWGGCLMIVDEVKEWGVQASMRLPQKEMRVTFLRLNHSEYYVIGDSMLVFDERKETE